jgi:hypothetical protein
VVELVIGKDEGDGEKTLGMLLLEDKLVLCSCYIIVLDGAESAPASKMDPSIRRFLCRAQVSLPGVTTLYQVELKGSIQYKNQHT